MARSLFALADDARALDDLLDGASAANDGVLPVDVDAAIQEWVGELEGATEVKAENIGWLLREWDARADAREEQAKQLREQAAADRARGKRLREYVLECLQRMGRTELTGSTLALKVQKNGGKDPLVLLGEVPRDFCRVEYIPDKDQIRNALERGKDLPFATLAPRGYSLRVR